MDLMQGSRSLCFHVYVSIVFSWGKENFVDEFLGGKTLICSNYCYLLPSSLLVDPSKVVSLKAEKKVNEGFPDSSVGKESSCNARDPSSIPGMGRSAGEK